MKTKSPTLLRGVKSRINEDVKLPPMHGHPQSNSGPFSLSAQLNTEARIAVVAQLAIQGLTQSEIAEKLDIDQAAVSNHLSEARRRWLDASIVAYDTMKAQELARINEIERQQWNELSALNDDDDDERRKSWWTTRQKNAYNRIMWCVEQRCKLFGLYAPQEVINWKTEAAQHGYDPDTIYRILVNEMSNIIDGQAHVMPQTQVSDDDASDTAL